MLEYGEEIKLSQRFIYYNTKKISGYWFAEGDSLRNALKAVCDYGACKEEMFPDTPENSWQEYVGKVPSQLAYFQAEEFKAKSYWSVPVTLENLKQSCYRNQRPLITGMGWYNEYYHIKEDGKLPLPVNAVGYHALVYVGWTKGKQWFRNSFGKDWGFQGYFYIPDEEFNRHSFFTDAWILLDIPYSIYIKTIGVLRQLIAVYQALIEKLKN
jgi:C1A family cysteine protease